MKRILIVLMVAVVLLAPTASTVAAQEPKEQVPLEIDLVISRQAGEKKISSLPYSLWVTASAERGRGTSLRMGVQVPVPTTIMSGKEGESTPVQSYTYRDVGTNIDVVAVTATGGRYQVEVTLTNTSIHEKTVSTSSITAPAIRNFTSRFDLVLRDGQSATYTSATDPVTGETLKVDVTLTVLK